MKKCILFIIMFFAIDAFSQNIEDFDFLNDSIKYDIRNYIGKEPREVSKYRVIVYCSKKMKKKFKKLEAEKIISLLQNSDRSFATNLLLYEIYERDSLWYFYNSTTPLEWKNNKQDTEIQYWKRFLNR